MCSAGCSLATSDDPVWSSPDAAGKADGQGGDVSISAPVDGWVTVTLRGPLATTTRRAFAGLPADFAIQGGEVYLELAEHWRCRDAGPPLCAFVVREHELTDLRTIADQPHEIAFSGGAASDLVELVPGRYLHPAQPRLLACDGGGCAVRKSAAGVVDGSRQSDAIVRYVATAPLGELTAILGAAATDDLRRRQGSFRHATQLLSVDGLGNAELAALADRVARLAYEQDNDYADGCSLSWWMWQPAPAHRDTFERIREDGLVTAAEVEQDLMPILQSLPDRATPTSRAALHLLDSATDAIEDEARVALGRALRDWFGYRVGLLEDGFWSAQLRAWNVTELDLDFACAHAQAPRPASELVLAVIDSGTFAGHDATLHALWSNPDELPKNGLDDDDNGLVDDVHGWDLVNGAALFDPSDSGDLHGLHVAAIAAAGTQRIRLVQLVDNIGFENPQSAAERRLHAFQYAADAGARVVNLSQLTADEHAAPLIQFMEDHPDILFVVAAGNDGSRVEPGTDRNHAIAAAGLENVVVVAASMLATAVPADYSNFHGVLVDVAYPGDRLSAQNGKNARFAVNAGTSQAAPGIANIAAKVMLIAPDLSPAEVKQILYDASVPADAWTGVVAAGGVVDARAAYAAARDAMVELVASP